MIKTDTLFDKIFNVACYIIIFFVVIVTFYPFYDVFVLSITPREEAVKAGMHLYTTNPTLEAYIQTLKSSLIKVGFINSVVRILLAVAISVTLTTLAAYPLTKKNMPFNRSITLFFLFTMFFNGGMIPTYLLINDLGLIDNIFSLVLPGAVGAGNLIIMRSFIETLPQSLEDAAKIDGASYFNIWSRVILPLMKPILATITLWVAVNHWNAYFDAMIYMHDITKQPMAVVLRRILVQSILAGISSQVMDELRSVSPVTPETTKAAVIMVTTIPIIIVYPFLQKYFAKGIMLGAVKG